MIAGRAALALSVVVIACLNAILLIGAAFPGRADLKPAFDATILAFDLALVSSSLLLGIFFARRRQRVMAVVFFANVGIEALALIYRGTGRTFSPLALFGADLYWLQLYVIVLVCYAKWILEPASRSR
ncbi:MAG TPA: hypothetical protein VG406_05770 [Isosphaeraceae bacterium]|jgi:Na+/glutamate symporter|nr:hypothetical protein [Isosphaeraceae bacterium]